MKTIFCKRIMESWLRAFLQLQTAQQCTLCCIKGAFVPPDQLRHLLQSIFQLPALKERETPLTTGFSAAEAAQSVSYFISMVLPRTRKLLPAQDTETTCWTKGSLQ